MHAKGIAGANSGLCRIGCDAGGGGRASLLHQGLRFRRRCWRLQFFVAGAVSGDRLRARCVLRCKSLFQREGGNAARSQPPIPKEILMRISGFGNSRNRSDFGGSSGTGPDIRRGISGLPACLRPDHLLRVQLYVAASMQRVGLGPLGAMRRQSLLGKCVSGSAHTQARRLLSAVLTERRSYSISTTFPSTSDTRRSIRPARSILWVAISIATRVAFTSCMSALNT